MLVRTNKQQSEQLRDNVKEAEQQRMIETTGRWLYERANKQRKVVSFKESRRRIELSLERKERSLRLLDKGKASGKEQSVQKPDSQALGRIHGYVSSSASFVAAPSLVSRLERL
jgi:hypothetical protein